MKNKDQPAFPGRYKTTTGFTTTYHWFNGITKRELACIKLRIPKSGDAELDALILEARRHDTAVMAMQGLIAGGGKRPVAEFVKESYIIADAMLEGE